MKRYIAAAMIAVVMVAGCAKSPHSSSVKIYIQQHQVEKAIREGKAWVQDEPQRADAHYWLAQAYALGQDYIHAAAELDTTYMLDKDSMVIKKFGEPEKVIYQNAGLQLKDKDIDLAIHYFQKALEIDPKDAKVTVTVAALYGIKGDKAKMFEYLKKAEQLAPEDPDVLYRLAVAYENEGQYDEAEKYLKKLIKVKPDMATAHYEYGILLFNKGDYEGAANEFKTSYELDSTKVEALYNWTQALLKLEKYDEAIKVAQKYAESNPNDPNGWFFLGGAYLSKANPTKEDMKKAVEALTKAIELDPNNPTYYEVRAAAYSALGDKDKAVEDIKKADEIKAAKEKGGEKK